MVGEVLVLDASTTVASLLAGKAGFDLYSDYDLIAPPLLWPEARSALHQIAWRKDIGPAEATAARTLLAEAPITIEHPGELGATAWAIADSYGWAKTYDAEYLALGRLRGCRVVTLDRRMHQRVDDSTVLIGPTELGDSGRPPR